MSGKLQGLTIDLGLDTMGIDEGLKGLQRKLKVVNSEMEANLSAFGKGERSVEKFGATLSGLSKKLEVQGKILDQSKKNYQELVKSQEDLARSLKTAEDRVQKSKRAYEELSKIQGVSKKELSEAAKEVRESEKAYQKLNKELIDLPKSIDNAANEVNRQTKAYNRLQDGVDNARSALNKLQDEQKQTLKGFDRLADKMSKSGDKMKNFGGSAMSAGQTLSLGATAPVAAFGVSAVKQAGEYDAAASQFKQVFGSMEKDATTSLDKISEKTGLLPNGLRGTYTQMAAFAKTTGADTKDAIDLTSRATLAAADSAAFYDKNISEVSENLQSFLKGNYENDAALGISATETTRNAKANEMFGKSFKDLNEQQKQLALLKMVEDGNKLSGALGQASREQDQLSTQTANLKTAWADFQSEVGKPILPAAVGILKDLSGAAKGASKWFGDLSDNQKKMVLGIGGVAAAAGPTLMAIGAMSSGIGALSKGFGIIGGGFKLFTKSGRESSKVAGGLSKVFGGLKDGLSGVGKVFGKLGSGAVKALPKVFGAVGKSIGGVTKAFNILKLAFATNPLGLILLAVTGLAAGLIYAYKHSEKFRNIVNGMGKAVAKVFGNIVGWAKDFGKDYAKGFGKAVDAVKNFGKNVGKKFGDMKDAAVKHTKALYKGVTGWFGDTSKDIKSKTSKAWGHTKENFEKMKDGAISRSKSLSKSVGNWFGDTRDSIKKTTGKAWSHTKENFENMKDGAISRSKKLYKGVTGWFGDVRDGIKNITKKAAGFAIDNFLNMYKGAKKWVEKIGDFITGFKDNLGRKAASLGRSVANGAISGLNGMIDGINKISSKIMDKKLLSRIPKLSTGTGLVRNGAIARPTLAIVGDKGPGNGSGGFTREVIHRANGDMELTPATDTLVHLNKGDRIYNGRQTQQLMKQGLIPRFESGTMWDKVHDIGSSIKDTFVDGAKFIGKIAGDVFDYIQHPGKLVDIVLGNLSKVFGGVGGLTGDLGGAAFKSIKKALIGKVKEWFEEFSGGADGSELLSFPLTTPYHPNGPTPGYPTAFNGGRHYGIDLGTPYGTLLHAPTSGYVKEQSDYGGGKVAQLVAGRVAQYFLHLSKVLKTGRVKQGDPIVRTGNSGHFTTGPHLHYQVEEPSSGMLTNRNTKDPIKFLKSKGGGKAGGNWASQIRQAASRMGTRVTGEDINDILALINRESSGNQSVVQHGYTDVNTGGNEARGLLQYTPGTFRGYAVSGHGNILKGFDQLLAFFNNSNWRGDLSAWERRIANGSTGWGPTGHRKFANGGMITEHQMYEGGEEGHEMVVPLTLSRRSRAIQLIEQAMKIVGMKQNSGGVTINSDTSTVELLLTKLVAAEERNAALTRELIEVVRSKPTGVTKGEIYRANKEVQNEQSRLNNMIQGKGAYA